MKYSDNEIESVRQLDIVSFLNTYEGFTFKRAGSGYRCEQHNSLFIYSDRKGWFWNSQNKGGATVIDYCQKIKGMSFPEAVKMIIGDTKDNNINIPKASQNADKTAAEKPFSLPQKAQAKADRLFAYLNLTRKIDANVISALKQDRKIYQDEKGNVVFVGFDEQNEAKYASIRGTLSDVQYRGEVLGSNKKYSFSVNGSNKTKLYIFESPIDLMSHCTLADIIIDNPKAWTVHNRLSLAGTSDVALEHYLSKNQDVKELIFCLDNDEAGRTATEKHIEKYSEKGYICSTVFSKAKDYNEELIHFVENKKNTITKPKGSANVL